MTFERIMRLPEIIPCDKRLHFLIGVILTSLLACFKLNLMYIFILIILIAFGIEIYQKITHTGKYEIFDAIAVIIGSVFVLLPLILKG